MNSGCEVCGVIATKRCTRCKAAFYCGKQHQLSHWKDHKSSCQAVEGAAKPKEKKIEFVPNPWYTPISPSTPNSIQPAENNELLQGAQACNLPMVATQISKGAQINATRTMNGETALFLAVTSGYTEAVDLLIKAGSTINTTDWKGNTPLYHAATHPGVNDCLKNDESKRCKIIQLLLDAGADTMAKGGFSGVTAFEQAKTLGYNEAAELILNEPTREKFCEIRDAINNPDPPKEIKLLVDQYREIYWRVSTATWFIQFNRDSTFQCFTPHPDLVRKLTKETSSVENMFIDANTRHKEWWASLKFLCNR